MHTALHFFISLDGKPVMTPLSGHSMFYQQPTDQGICEDGCHNTSKVSFVVMQVTGGDNHFCKLRIESHGIRDRMAITTTNPALIITQNASM